MSYTTTTNYGLIKPDISSEVGTWGVDLNTNADALDAALNAIQQQINTLDNAFKVTM